MQVQVVAESPSVDVPPLAARVTELLKGLGNDHRKIVQAEAYGPVGLVDILEVRAVGGQHEILVMGCSRIQIQAVLDWQSCADDEHKFNNLLLHLVRKPDNCR